MQETNDQAPAASGVRFGPFELLVETGELRKDGVRLKLSGQPIQVLTRLVATPGKVVTREELQQELWPASSYGDFEKGLNAAVNRLREYLGDSAAEPKYIETIPLRGYRFIAEMGPKGALAPGKVVSHYQIVGVLGRGGMGIVYRARDLNLGRDVGLKFLPDELAANQDALARFRREASTASALNHPNICTVYEIGEADGRTFIAMEFLDGVTLKHLISFGPMNTHSVLSMGIEIASALGAVHREGIIHRDIKPGNIFVTKHGHMKIVDFGLAKETGERASMAETIGADSDTQPLTSPGTLTGTVEYMSPEQVKDCELDARTDLFSFGAVLFEMATGKRPFGGSSLGEICSAILYDNPVHPSKLNPEVPAELDRIIGQLLQKNREDRYGSAYEVRTDLSGLKQELLGPTSLPVGRLLRHPVIAIPLILTVITVVLASAWLVRRNAKMRWAREQALPQIVQLIQQDRNPEAFALAKQAERYIPNDPMLAESWPRMSRVVNIHTDPEGADVYVKPYETPDGKWQYLGRSPLLKTQIPLAFLRWKLQIAGYKDFEGTLPDEQWLSLQVTPNSPVEIMFALIKSGSAQAGMVRIPGGKFSPDITGLDYLPDVQLQDFWIDQHEVTNEEYKKFVAAGGYTNPRYWKVPFVKDNKTLSWEEALQLFLDKTGRPGPATWELGEYPEGQGNYPVVGVSWFEAAAYAEFVGKSLPSVYHWNRAAATWATNWIAPLSNFSGRGPSPANAYPGLGPYGTYDMAGNAKEWCWNSSGDNRYILGGAWDEVVYMFVEPDAQSPFRRAPNYGFRLAKYDSQPDKLSLAPLEPARRDFTKEKPIPAALFAIYRTVYTYDKTPMDPVVEVTDDTSPFWTQQKVTINAAYGNERYSLLVFLPKHGRPPYQTVVYFPGSNAIDQRSSNGLRLHGTSALDLLIRSGRAVVVPVYKGIYERGDTLNSPYPQTTSLYRDHVIDWAKDLGRAVDYIQTRSDLDHEKLAYYGFSWGGAIAPVMLSIETRFKAAVLLSGGFHFQRSLPEVDEFNFAPYVTVPTLMINGRYDFIFPVGLSQNPMFQSLGTAANYKRHVVLDTGHLPPREITAKETLDWLDHYLGPVNQATPQN